MLLHFRLRLGAATLARAYTPDARALAALDAYRERFGDVLVPAKFVVPAEPAGGWPAEARGMKLGKEVLALRSAMARHGPTLAPPPAGQEQRAAPQRRGAHKRRGDTGGDSAAAAVVAALDELGFVWDVPRWRFWRVLAALKVYHAMPWASHAPMRTTFVVPSEAPWPEQSWGLALGRRRRDIGQAAMFVMHSPERRAQLHELGVRWDDEQHRTWGWRWLEVLAALRAFKREFGHARVPAMFAVPHEAPWPEEAWGMQLGSRARNIAASGEFVAGLPARRAELTALGFEWGGWERRQPVAWPAVLAALRAFTREFGHARVPAAFAVPREAPWPEEAWGMKLGGRVNGIRSHDNYFASSDPERRAALDALGFVWSDQERRWGAVLAALREFKRQHGHLQVHGEFVVPAEAPWPEEAWGMKLGGRVHGIRSSNDYIGDNPERRAELSALGFVWSERERVWGEVRAALLAYRAQYGDLDVPSTFEVPSRVPWPEVAWGMALGARVSKIRGSEEYLVGRPARRAELESLGFTWHPHSELWKQFGLGGATGASAKGGGVFMSDDEDAFE